MADTSDASRYMGTLKDAVRQLSARVDDAPITAEFGLLSARVQELATLLTYVGSNFPSERQVARRAAERLLASRILTTIQMADKLLEMSQAQIELLADEIDEVVTATCQTVIAAASEQAPLVKWDYDLYEWASRRLDRRARDATGADYVKDIYRIRQLTNEAQQNLSAQRNAVSDSADISLSQHYSDLAAREGRVAIGWRILAVISVIAAGALSLTLSQESTATIEVVHRVAVSVGALALAGFFATEAGKHGRASQWARIVSVQLKTIDAYCATLSDADTSAVRTMFALRVFGDVSGKDAESGMPSVDLLASIADRFKPGS